MSEFWGFSIQTDFWPRGRMHERRIQPCQDRPGASLDWGGQEQADWPVPGYSDSSHRFHDSAAISHSTNLPQLVQHRANPLHLPGEGGPDLNMISMSHHNCCILTLSGAGGLGDMVMTEKKHVAKFCLDFHLTQPNVGYIVFLANLIWKPQFKTFWNPASNRVKEYQTDTF